MWKWLFVNKSWSIKVRTIILTSIILTSISLVEPVRNIYLMTSIGQFRSLTWGHLRSRSCVGSCRSCCIYQPMRLDETNIGINPVSVSLSDQKLFPKTTLVTSDDLSRGHIAPYFRLLSITFDWIETQAWEWYQYVCLAKAHRLICNMTYLNHHVTLTWDDLRSNFEIDLSRSSIIFRTGSTSEPHWF